MKKVTQGIRVRLVMAALMATCFQLAVGPLRPANAQIGDGSVKFLSYTGSQLFGIAQDRRRASVLAP